MMELFKKTKEKIIEPIRNLWRICIAALTVSILALLLAVSR